jgi:hypothetical protein
MTGSWKEIDNPWYASRIVNCAFCGQMIARRTFTVSVGINSEHFCSETCAERADEARTKETGTAL